MHGSRTATVFTARLHIFVHGGFNLLGPDGNVVPIVNHKAKGLLAYLALCPSGIETRERLCGLLWGDRSEHQARASLRQTLKQLRVVFGGIGFNGFETGRREISIDHKKITVDLQAQASNLESDRVGQSLLNEDGLPEKILYGYEDLDPSFGEWLVGIRQNWRTRLFEQLSRIMENSEPEQSKRAAQAIVNIDPADEKACRLLIRHYATSGNTALALKQYNRLWDVLDAEYDIEPDEETQSLIAQTKMGVLDAAARNNKKPKEVLSAVDGEKTNPAIVLIDLTNKAISEVEKTEGAFRSWRFQQEKIIMSAVVAESGEVIKKTCGRVLVEFDSCVDAANFSLKLGKLLGVSPQANERPFFASIAVNVNKFYSDAHDLFAEALNITVQLLNYSDACSVVMTSEFYDQVRDTVEFSSVDLGFLQLKSTSQRVRVKKIILDDAVVEDKMPRRGMLPSLAVLPFSVYGPDPKIGFLANGMVHEIVGMLTTLRAVFVISSGSTFFTQSVDVDIKEVAQRLGVQYILIGSIVPEGELLNIQVELIDTDDLQVIWTDNFIVELSNIFEAQHAIAIKTTYALLPHLHIAELQRIALKVPESLDAYDYVLKGVEHLYKLSEEGFRISGEYFSRAIQINPGFANAYAMKAKWHILYVGEGKTNNVRAHSEQALEMAKLALHHDPLNAFALSIYGHVNSFLFRNYRQALDAFEKAISASPNSAIAWGLSAPTFSYINENDEAIKRVERALALSPLEPDAYFYKSTLTSAHYSNATYEEAVYWGRKTMATAPNFIANLRPLIASLSAMGELDEARVLAGQLLKIDPGFSVSKFCKWYPIKEAKQVALYAQHLLAAGVPV